MRHDTVDDAGYGARNNSARVVDTVAHCITAADLDRDTVLVAQLHEFKTEGNDVAVNIGSGNVLEVAAGADTHLQTLLDDREIMLHRFAACHMHLIENMIVRA